MKKTLLSLLITIMSITFFGQVNIGIKGGVNFSKFQVDIDGIDYTRGPGFDIGAFARLGNSFYFQPEILFSSKSTEAEISDDLFGDITNRTGNVKENFKNLELPLLIGYKFGSNRTNFRIFAGPRLGFLLSNKISDYWKDAENKNFDFAGQVGIGLDVWMLTVDFLYDYTFTESYSGKIVTTNGLIESSPHFSCYKLMVGIKLF